MKIIRGSKQKVKKKHKKRERRVERGRRII
jgi:hypothetical protein